MNRLVLLLVLLNQRKRPRVCENETNPLEFCIFEPSVYVLSWCKFDVVKCVTNFILCVIEIDGLIVLNM